jgi:hypothetical protein
MVERVLMYTYLGDKNTSPVLRGNKCTAVLRNGKCIRAKNGNMLVEFDEFGKHVIVARLLRKVTIDYDCHYPTKQAPVNEKSL